MSLSQRYKPWVQAGILLWCHSPRAGPEVMILFSFSTLLSMNFILLINIEIANIDGIFRFKSPKSQSCIPLMNVKMPTIVGHFNIYEQDKFQAQLS